MKSVLCLLLCFLLLLSLSACRNSTDPSSSTQVVNPVRNVDGPKDFMRELGVTLFVPDHTTNHTFSIISSQIAQIQFTWDDADYVLRCANTDEDISGVHSSFTGNESFIDKYSEYSNCIIRIRYTSEGGALADWKLGPTSYTLYTATLSKHDEFPDVVDVIARFLIYDFRDHAPGYTYSEDLLVITSGNTDFYPLIGSTYNKIWGDHSFIVTDALTPVDNLNALELHGLWPHILPSITYQENFSLTYKNNTQLDTVIIYNVELEELERHHDVDCFASLARETYFVAIYVKQPGNYIEQANDYEYTGYSCVFELIVP